MHENNLIIEILRQLEFAVNRIIDSCENIKTANDFNISNDGILRLESTCMLLSTIGESVKNIDKRTEGKLLIKYPTIEWKKIMGMRDMIVHHYFDIDIETIWDVVQNKLPELIIVLEKMITDESQ
ncbi:DUF86 domain-containing protein [Bacteroidales bacterium OttesenSCG-928-L19]|nr:DUF86 domain-containing protein [Bacteroidales bacterium OttesenSCG-928-L19]